MESYFWHKQEPLFACRHLPLSPCTVALILACLMSPNVLRTRPVQVSQGPGGCRRTGPSRVPEGGVRASELGPGGGDQPVPQWDVLPALPAPAPGLDPGLRPRGSNLHRQIHS